MLPVSLSQLETFFTDPVGSWPSDLWDKALLECRRISACYVDLYHEKLVIKSILKPSARVDTERLAREVNMVLLAGEDCAIPIVGRFFLHGVINGFVTQFGKCLTQGKRSDISPEIFERRLEVIQQFCALLDRLHSKAIIHGDIKPSNLVLDAGNNLRFIDFAEAVLESEPPRRRGSTIHYCLPASMQPGFPLTRANDMYAAGVTIWHIYTGHLPFQNVDEDDLEHLIADGLRPDLSAIDDEAVRSLICTYLQAGESLAPKLLCKSVRGFISSS
jgi:serine/threonine protein kinase